MMWMYFTSICILNKTSRNSLLAYIKYHIWMSLKMPCLGVRFLVDRHQQDRPFKRDDVFSEEASPIHGDVQIMEALWFSVLDKVSLITEENLTSDIGHLLQSLVSLRNGKCHRWTLSRRPCRFDACRVGEFNYVN